MGRGARTWPAAAGSGHVRGSGVQLNDLSM